MKRTNARTAILATFVLIAFAAPGLATMSGDRYELQARFSIQNTFHHDSIEEIDWVQERNELRFDFKYNLLAYGQTMPILNAAKFNLLYRARYDSIFDIRDSYGKRGYRRDDMRFPEGKTPREVFVDLEFSGILNGLGARIGRQQVVWGEADVFRSIDVVNPLRLDQNGLVGDDFADFREPLWIAKFFYDIGDFGPLISNAGLEWLYSPNGRPITHRAVIGEAFRVGNDENNPVDGFKRPNSSPFDRVRYPWELQRVGHRYADAGDEADLGPLLGKSDFMYLGSRNIPTSEFDLDASMFGARFLGTTFAGINFTLNYLFKRAELPGTALQGDALFDPTILPDTGLPNSRLDLLTQAVVAAANVTDANGNGYPDGNEDLVRRCIYDKEPLFVLDDLHGSGNPLTGCQPVAFWYPWTHIVGATFTYNDYDYTGAVFRIEESYSTKEPRNATPPLNGPRAGDFPRQRDFDTNSIRQTDVWRSMIGFDYLRSLGLVAARKWPQPFRSLFGQDQWLISGQFFNEYYANANSQIGLTDSPTDRQQHWNPIFTTLLTGFFVNNRLRPWVSFAYEVNHSTPILWLQAEYNIGARWSVRAGEIIYMGSKNAESPLLLHRYADRDTFFLRLTYFLI